LSDRSPAPEHWSTDADPQAGKPAGHAGVAPRGCAIGTLEHPAIDVAGRSAKGGVEGAWVAGIDDERAEIRARTWQAGAGRVPRQPAVRALEQRVVVGPVQRAGILRVDSQNRYRRSAELGPVVGRVRGLKQRAGRRDI